MFRLLFQTCTITSTITSALAISSYPLSTAPLPDPSLKMIPLDLPTKDFDTTADDLHFCKELNYCSHNGRCDVELIKCICDAPWTGAQCDQGSMVTSKGNNRVLVTELNPKTMARDDRADGNELFLAKAHHRLRQVVAELSLTGDPTENLVAEKYHLMRSLGLLYTSVGSSAHELTLGLEPAKVASRHPSHRRLPNVMTMRWNNPIPKDEDIKEAVQAAFQNALQDVVAHSKTTSPGSSLTSIDAPDQQSHFGVFDERGGGAAGDRDLEKITGANSTTTVVSTGAKDPNAPIRNINTEDDWNVDYDKPSVLDVNHERTDMLPGLDLLYSLPDEQNAMGSESNDLVEVPPMNVAEAFNKDVEAALKLKEEHKAKEILVNQKLDEEVQLEETRFKELHVDNKM